MKRKYVFVLTYVNETEVYLFSNGTSAYNYIVEELKNSPKFTDEKEEMLQELAEDYNNYPDSFGIESYCWARLEEVIDERE